MRDIIVDLLAEKSLGFLDDEFVRHVHVAVFVDGDIFRVVHREVVLLVGLLLGGRELFEHAAHGSRSGKDVADVLEQEIAHEAAPDDLFRLDRARDRQHLRRIELDHLAIVVLGDDGKEIQQAFDMLLVLLLRPAAVRRRGIEVVREIVENHQRALGCEIEDIGVFLLIELAVLLVRVGVLRAERGLHILGGALHIGQDKDRRPRLHRDARRELPNGQRDRAVVVRDGIEHLVIALLVFRVIRFIEPSVARRDHDLVLLEDGMPFQQLRHRFHAVHAVKKPERMA